MMGSLVRGEFVRLAYRLGRGQATGRLTVQEGGGGTRHELWLRRGYMTAAVVQGHWAPLGELLRDAGQIDDRQLRASLEAMAAGPGLQGRTLVAQGAVSPAAVDAALARQADLRLERLAAIPGGDYAFDAHAEGGPPAAGARCRPVALATWARRHIELHLDAHHARAFAGELWGARLAVSKHLLPDPTTLDDTDRRILDALAAPRRLDELEAAAHAPRLRLLAFLFFLRTVGALDLVGVAAHAGAATVSTAGPPPTPDEVERARAQHLLGVRAGDAPEAIRRAYRRLARALHPDLHPGVPDATRRGLEARFAAVTDAYRALLD